MIEGVVEVLSSLETTYLDRHPVQIRAQLASLKRECLETGKMAAANEIWCLERILEIQTAFVAAFSHCKLKEYYAAWSSLSEAESHLRQLKPHLASQWDDFSLSFIERKTAEFQFLFPYKLFMSAGFVAKHQKCSICGARRSFRPGCEHVPGAIYGGELCAVIIDECELLEVSFVENPVNKYAVPFTVDDTGKTIDEYDYSFVGYVVDGLQSPFDEWAAEDAFRYDSHSQFDVGRNGACPCGSRLKYKRCCWNRAGVRFPHKQISFSKPPPASFPRFVGANEAKRRGTLWRVEGVESIWSRLSPAPPPETDWCKGTPPNDSVRRFTGTVIKYDNPR